MDKPHRRHHRHYYNPHNTGTRGYLLAGLAVVTGVVMMVGAVVFLINRTGSPPAVSKGNAPITPTLPVKGDPLPTTPDNPPNNANKGSGNSGSKNNVMVIEGNKNVVHVGDNVTNNINITIVVPEPAPAAPRSTTPPPTLTTAAPQSTTPTTPTGRRPDPSCEVALQKHNATVAAWRAEFNK